jgi:hypothetical protein
MYDRYKFEAYFWQAFAHLALTGKRSIEDFRAELARCASGDPLTDEDVTKILNEFYAALSLAPDSTVSEPGSAEDGTKEGFESV